MFARVVDGAVIQVLPAMPESTESVSGFDLLSPADQAGFGYFPFVEIKPTFNPTTQKLSQVPFYTFSATQVTATYAKITLTATELAANLDVVKARKVTEFNAACGAQIVGGFTSSALGAVYTYTATLEDQANLLGLIAIGASGEFTCTDTAGVKARRLHTMAQLRTVLTDGGAFKDSLLAKVRTLKDRIAAAPNTDLPDSSSVEALTW